MQKPWSLYNKEDKLRIDNLSTDQVKIVLLATPMQRMNHWFACQEGELHWLPISTIPEFYEDVRVIKGDMNAPAPDFNQQNESAPAAAKNSNERRPLFEEPPDAPSGITLQVDQSNTKERRSARRYERQLGFQVQIAQNRFETHTLDVSMSGSSLAETLPPWVPQNFEARLISGHQTVKIRCVKVDDTKIRFRESTAWDMIRGWIVGW